MFTLTTVRDGLSCLRIRYHSWGSTSGIIQLLKTRQKFWGADPQYGWPDPDFIYTGGQGCPNGRDPSDPSANQTNPPGQRCPGQSETEYHLRPHIRLSIRTGSLGWLRFTYVFESRSA